MKNNIIHRCFLLITALTITTYCFSDCGCDTLKLALKDKTVFSKLRTENDTLCLIKCLMEFKADGRLNDVWSTFTKDADEVVFLRSKSSSNPYRPHAPNNIVALYLITSLFKNDFQFCNRLMLVDSSNIENIRLITNIQEKYQDGKYRRMYSGNLLPIRYKNTNSKDIKLIYKDVSEWYKIIEEKGLSYVRENNLEPISKTRKISWR